MTTNAILIAVAIFLAGLLVGAVFGRHLARREGRRDRLADQLRAREEKLQIYEREVEEHFRRAAALTDDLGRAWQDLQQHLASSADQLASTELAQRFTTSSAAHPAGADPQPPRDYAPSQGLLRGKPRAVADQAGKGSAGIAGTITPLPTISDDDPTLKVG
ncbi:MAG: YhcB family protein [Porticoccaceae bacterium]